MFSQNQALDLKSHIFPADNLISRTLFKDTILMYSGFMPKGIPPTIALLGATRKPVSLLTRRLVYKYFSNDSGL